MLSGVLLAMVQSDLPVQFDRYCLTFDKFPSAEVKNSSICFLNIKHRFPIDSPPVTELTAPSGNSTV